MNENHYNKVFDYLKHFTTLSSGSVLLLATLLDKVIKSPRCSYLIYFSIIGFLISIIGAMATYTFGISKLANPNDKSQGWQETLGGLGILMTWVGFLIGIISIGIFTIMNHS